MMSYSCFLIFKIYTEMSIDEILDSTSHKRKKWVWITSSKTDQD